MDSDGTEGLEMAARAEAERIGGVLHETNNWLGVALGHLELLSVRRDLPPDAQARVREALLATERIAERVSDVQGYVRGLRLGG